MEKSVRFLLKSYGKAHLQSFLQMISQNPLLPGEIGDGARDFENAVITAYTELIVVIGVSHQILTVGIQRTETVYQLRRNPRIIGKGKSGVSSGLQSVCPLNVR